MTGIERIAIERQHQIDNGWTLEHDRDSGEFHIPGLLWERFKAELKTRLTDEQWAELGAFAAAELDRRAALEVGE